MCLRNIIDKLGWQALQERSLVASAQEDVARGCSWAHDPGAAWCVVSCTHRLVVNADCV